MATRTKDREREAERDRREHEWSLESIADVVRQGGKIILPAEPEPMATRTAADLLRRLAEQEDEDVALIVNFDTTPFAGAVAFMAVLSRMYNFVVNKPTPGWFGQKHPPAAVQVEVGPDETREVIWGRYQIPGTSITLDCAVGNKQNVAVFALHGTCKRRDRHLAEELFKAVREQIAAETIYRGRAIQLKVADDGNLELDDPDSVRFLKVDPTLRDSLILNTAAERAVNVELYTPIEKRDECKARGISLNRVILLAGEYGTGKSMTGGAVAAVTAANEGTFILLHNVRVLTQVLAFAKVCKLPRVVVFAEDIDQIMASGERDETKNTLLNIISGAESSTIEVILVLTTNHIESIHPAMIRRFKAVIEYELPDPPAVERLIHVYAQGQIEGPLTKSRQELANTMPSLIQDTVESAVLSAIAEGRTTKLRDEDFVHVAEQIKTRKRLSTKREEPTPLVDAMKQVGSALQGNHSDTLDAMKRQLAELHGRIM